MRTLSTDVFVVGTGPAGAVFARVLVPAGARVVMADAGEQMSLRPGRNLKNVYAYQRNPDRFAELVNGLLHPLSPSPTPEMVNAGLANPRQDPERNLDGAATAYAVGGQAIHWTGVIPRQHPTMERSPIFDDAEWDRLYTEAEDALDKTDGAFDGSVRHTVIREAVAAHYEGRLEPGREVGTLPMALRPVEGGADPLAQGLLWVAGADTVLRNVLDADPAYGPERFRILPEHVVRRLVVDGGRVTKALAYDLVRNEEVEIRADTFVVAGGTVLGAQLLWASGIRPPALGRYLVEHPISFAQVVLRDELQERIRSDARFAEARRTARPDDPLRLPAHDRSPNVWIPVGEGRPWHVQITKDIVHFSPPPKDVDDRVVTDLRWYTLIDPDPDNRVTFEEDLVDAFGLPRPTVHYHLDGTQTAKIEAMMEDQRDAARALGTFRPGVEPALLPSGACLHLQGATRMGAADDGTSVVDPSSKVWGYDNLVLAGNSVIPTGNACNPTLTTVALALRAAHDLVDSTRT